MKVLLYILIIVSFLQAQTDVSGNVSGTWTVANSPYIAINNLVLQPADELTIEPGVEIRFDGNFRFDVFGYLLAVGTEADSITFTRNGDTDWMSINFAQDTDDNSKLQYCRNITVLH